MIDLERLGELNIVSPCDKCEHRDLCARDRLACNDFSYFVTNAKVINRKRIPNREIYLKHFPTDPQKRINKRKKC
jgi:hypothetical protein